jgi:hypothetical protein
MKIYVHWDYTTFNYMSQTTNMQLVCNFPTKTWTFWNIIVTLENLALANGSLIWHITCQVEVGFGQSYLIFCLNCKIVVACKFGSHGEDMDYINMPS